MKVICDREAFLLSAAPLIKLASKRSFRPQLNSVRLVAERRDKESTLRMTATDAETWMVLAMGGVDVLEPGEALLPAEQLSRVVGAIRSGTFKIEGEGGDRWSMSGDDERFILFGYPPKDYPPPPTPGEGSPVDAAALHRAISMCVPAMSAQNSRYAISGIGLLPHAGKMEAVATDGRWQTVVPVGVKWAKGVILPASAIPAVLWLLAAIDGNVNVHADEGRIYFGSDGCEVWSNLIEGTFPPYREVFRNDEPQIKCNVNCKEWLAAIGAVSLLADDGAEGRTIAIGLDPANGFADLTGSAAERGRAEVRVGVDSPIGSAVRWGINPAFLASALRACGADFAELRIWGANKIGSVRAGDYLSLLAAKNIDHLTLPDAK